MKRRSDKLNKVVAIASSEERQSGQAAGQLQQRLEEQLARLGELNAFRHNYTRPKTGSIRAQHWQDYQSFLARLDTAVRSQQQIIHDCEQKLEVQRRRWMAKRRKLESLQRLLDNSLARESRESERQEQKRLDDLTRPPAATTED